MPELNEPEILVLAQIIDQLNYYEILKVEPGASALQLREAFHRESKQFHPDTVYHLPDGPLKDAVFLISKRVTEAYVILRNLQKRRQYDRGLAESDGKKIRYTEESEKEQKKKSEEEQFGKTEQGRKAFRDGLRWMKSKNYQMAEQAFRSALMYEPDNKLFKEKADECNQAIGMDRFKIR